VTADQIDPLVFARRLIDQGVPVFVAKPDPGSGTGFYLPRGWQNTRTNPRLLEAWKPGAALCAVTGVALDVIDIDPRNGGDTAWESFTSEHPSPRVYAEVATPSGGRHLYVARTRHGKVSRDGIDLQAGDDNGQGRGFVFLPGTVRSSKTDGQPRPYVLVSDRLDTFGQDDDSGAVFLAWVTSGRKAPADGDGFGTVASAGIAGGLGEPITVNHDNTLAAYTASLVARGVREGEAWQLVQARLRDVVGGDPARPFTRTDFERWWSGAVRKYAPGGTEEQARPDPVADVAPMTLADAEAVFRRYLGESYDVDTLRVCLAAEAVRRLDGDPLWVMVVSGSGNAKTETVQAFSGAGATIAATLSGESALLSATQKRDRSADATGGLLRTLGDSGTLVLKDFTSVLSMNRDRRAEVLGALREVYDGSWTRLVGAEGGRQLEWSGRVGLIAACTTAWDSHGAVVATMGDRFAVIRADSREGRLGSGRQSLSNVGTETDMRRDLAAAVAGVIAGMVDPGVLTDDENETLLAAADLTTLARSAVETDYKGAVEWAHAPEMPTRFAKQLAQVARGGIACGMPRGEAMRLALRVAQDSVPPLRLAVLRAVAAGPGLTTHAVAAAVQKPWATTDRTLQALHAHGLVLTIADDAEDKRWRYELAPDVDLTVLEWDPRKRPNKPVETATHPEMQELGTFPGVFRTGAERSNSDTGHGHGDGIHRVRDTVGTRWDTVGEQSTETDIPATDQVPTPTPGTARNGHSPLPQLGGPAPHTKGTDTTEGTANPDQPDRATNFGDALADNPDLRDPNWIGPRHIPSSDVARLIENDPNLRPIVHAGPARTRDRFGNPRCTVCHAPMYQDESIANGRCATGPCATEGETT
jgi:hypothetical protein